MSGNWTTGVESHGGALADRNGRVNVTRSTVTDNHVTGAGATGGGLWIYHNADPTIILSSIIAVNTATDGSPDIAPDGGGLNVDFSLIGDTTGLAGDKLAAIIAGIGNLIDVDPMLAPLADDGGPTWTHVPMPGSPAIDVGIIGPSLYDQRGAPYLRLRGNGVDMGAVESGEGNMAPPLALVVDTLVDEADTDNGPGDFSLREAIIWANALPGPNTISFASSLDGGTIDLALLELIITDELTIDATSLSGGLTIDAQQRSRVANVYASSGDVAFAGLTITGGRSSGVNTNYYDTTYGGGAIRSLSTGMLTIDRCVIAGNTTGGDYARGGGVFSLGDVTITSSTVSDNGTSGDFARGGGVHAAGTVTLHDAEVSKNHTMNAEGGGINAYHVDLVDSVVAENMIMNDGDGGGVFANTVDMLRSTVRSNVTYGDRTEGGGIKAVAVTLTDSTVADNRTFGNLSPGGGVRAQTVTMYRSIITGNATTGRESLGGGISAATVVVHDSVVSGNYTEERGSRGGGIYATHVNLYYSTVSNNHTAGYAASGGGVSANEFSASNSTVSGNITHGDDATGGGIDAVNVTVVNSTISENVTMGFHAYGAGIYANGNVSLTQSTISGHGAEGSSTNGGGVVSLHGSIAVAYSTIAFNHATGAGAGIWNGSDAPLTITSSLISDNVADVGFSDLIPGTGSLTVEFTLIGDTSDLNAGTLATLNAGTGNLLDVDAKLAPLADNGGPTKTHALSPDSPAIDAGGITAFVYDQRGAPHYRVRGNGIDLGAYEFGASDFTPPTSFVVSTLADELDEDIGTGDLSLREAIYWANAHPGPDTITFDVSLAGGTIGLEYHDLIVADAVTIDVGNLIGGITIDAHEQSRVFNVIASSGYFTFTGLARWRSDDGR
ncbi:MAG: choice-of-anchor Q domain-containing protein [Pirellulales bacterium]